LGVKYGMNRKTAKKWVAGQGRDCYRLTVIQTPAGPRILDPQLELPPHHTAEPDEMFIFRASEIAKLVGVSKRWVNQLAEDTKIRYRMYGNKRFFPISEVRRLLSARGGCPHLDGSKPFSGASDSEKLDR
jgi:excisionase family DNA binding protein